MAKTTRNERREHVERLLAEDHLRTNRQIARLAVVSHTHVANVRKRLEDAGRIDPRPARPATATQAGYGNLTRQQHGQSSPARISGAHSPAEVAPLRARFLLELTAEYPPGTSSAAARVLAVQAGRQARWQLLTDHVDRRGLSAVVGRDGKPRPLALHLQRLEDAIERCYANLEARKAAQGKAGNASAQAALDAHLRELAQRRETGPAELGQGSTNGTTGGREVLS